MDAVLNYPQFFMTRDLFLHSKDMTEIKNFYNNWGGIVGQNNLQYLGNFNDNHDNARFLSSNINEELTNEFGNSTVERFLQATYDDAKYRRFKAFTAF